jgi:hypothetical protein
MKVPHSCVPEIESLVVAEHLGLDDRNILDRSLLSRWGQIDKVTSHPSQDAAFEFDEVGIDAHPVASVLPMCGPDVLTLDRLGRSLSSHSHPG